MGVHSRSFLKGKRFAFRRKDQLMCCEQCAMMEVNSESYWECHHKVMRILHSLHFVGPDVDYAATLITQFFGGREAELRTANEEPMPEPSAPEAT